MVEEKNQQHIFKDVEFCFCCVGLFSNKKRFSLEKFPVVETWKNRNHSRVSFLVVFLFFFYFFFRFCSFNGSVDCDEDRSFIASVLLVAGSAHTDTHALSSLKITPHILYIERKRKRERIRSSRNRSKRKSSIRLHSVDRRGAVSACFHGSGNIKFYIPI